MSQSKLMEIHGNITSSQAGVLRQLLLAVKQEMEGAQLVQFEEVGDYQCFLYQTLGQGYQAILAFREYS